LEFPVVLKEIELSGLTKVSPQQANIRYEIPAQIETSYQWILPAGVSSTVTLDY
jgi:hypothetical protein